MIIATPLPSGFSLRLRPEPFLPAAASQPLDARVEEIWEAESKRRGRVLTNGGMLCLDEIDRSTYWARVTDYRHFIASLRDRSVRSLFNRRFLGVSGLVCEGERILFGRRAPTSTQFPRAWELVPSGGLTPSVADSASDLVSVEEQVLSELEEEVGIGRSDVISSTPTVALDDATDGVLDIGVQLRVSDGCARTSRTDEYEGDVIGVATADIQRFTSERTVVPTSVAFLESLGLLPQRKR